MSYTLLTEDDRRAMLKAIGVNSIEDLLTGIPADIRLRRPLDIPPALSEIELTQLAHQLAQRNLSTDNAVCFLGGGAYDHFIPSVVDAITSRGEYYTAYTPYQAEASQGSLQAGFEFQTLICELTGLDVANASLYDGGTAVAEAVLMAVSSTGRTGSVLVAESVNPEYRQTLATFLKPLNISLVTLPAPGGIVEPTAVADAVDDTTIAVVMQHPNYFGNLEDMDTIGATAKKHGAVFIASFDPISVGLLRRPGDYGADIAVAEGQCLGNPLMYGGPYLGILACRSDFVRKIPGRLVGQTTDRKGNRCWVLTLQTREQHIRREKATSNICTNQALLALRATVYLTALGPQGLKETAELCARKAHYLAEQLTQRTKLRPAFNRPFFKEFVVRVPGDVSKLLDRLADEHILGGLPLDRDYKALNDGLLIAVTEKRTKDEMDAFVDAICRHCNETSA